MRTNCPGTSSCVHYVALTCVGALACAPQESFNPGSIESSREAITVVATGFRILSDHATSPRPTAIFPVNGLTAGAVVGTTQCYLNDARCLWQMHDGMIVSAADPTLALTAGPNNTAPTLTRHCGPNNAACGWAWVDGILKSALNYIPLNAAYGPGSGMLLINSACTSSNPDCTWTLESVSIRVNGNTMFGWNAFGAAYDGAKVGLWGCDDPSYANCLWTMKQGVIASVQTPSLAVVYNKNASSSQLYMSPIRAGESYRWSIDFAGRIGDRDSSAVTYAAGGPGWGTPVEMEPRDDCDYPDGSCNWTEMRVRNFDGGF
jgi:hypothetical protein